jgi:hypothetical protein
MNYLCKTCGEKHDDLPMAYGALAPAPWYALPEDERDKRAELNSDLCVIDDQYFFVLGRLEIPVLDSSELFAWLVWVSLSEKSFLRKMELWETRGREREPPQFGWLCTSLPCYPETLQLKTHVHTRPVGERPYIELEPTDHPLAIEQRQGIMMRRVQEIAEQVLHDNRA